MGINVGDIIYHNTLYSINSGQYVQSYSSNNQNDVYVYNRYTMRGSWYLQVYISDLRDRSTASIVNSSGNNIDYMSTASGGWSQNRSGVYPTNNFAESGSYYYQGGYTLISILYASSIGGNRGQFSISRLYQSNLPWRAWHLANINPGFNGFQSSGNKITASNVNTGHVSEL